MMITVEGRSGRTFLHHLAHEYLRETGDNLRDRQRDLVSGRLLDDLGPQG